MLFMTGASETHIKVASEPNGINLEPIGDSTLGSLISLEKLIIHRINFLNV